MITSRKCTTPKQPLEKCILKCTLNVPTTPRNMTTLQTETTARQISDKDEVSNLTVAVRIRPMNTKELSIIGTHNIVKVQDRKVIVRAPSTASCNTSTDHTFQYDHVFWSCDENSPLYSSQEDIFYIIGQPLLNSAFKGYNACLFAYGQTGSGKSFSMMGPHKLTEYIENMSSLIGIIPRFCKELFTRLDDYSDCSVSVEISYYEIYNEKIHDLLCENDLDGPNGRPVLRVREHPELGPYVVNLSSHLVSNYNELCNWLILGNKNRTTMETDMNNQSSRSHSIFSIELSISDQKRERVVRRSKVHLVDLAGSERLSTNTKGEERLRQGVSINKSLLTLGKVITALSDQKIQYVPYRDSVLTWLLKESLGGNSLTAMLATITPASNHVDETLATLRYACQARSIVNRVHINENPQDRIIKELRLELERLNALNNYEKNSFSEKSLNSSANSMENDELNRLKEKLQETERKLVETEKKCVDQVRQHEKEKQEEINSLAKQKSSLEMHVKNVFNPEMVQKLCVPYASTFLDDVDKILCENDENIPPISILVEKLINYCRENRLQFNYDKMLFTVIDEQNNRKSVFFLNDYLATQNISEIFRNLTWTQYSKEGKFNKTKLANSFNQIYTALNNLQPSNNDNRLNLLFAKVNKSLQCFEAALLNSYSTNNCKNVTFDI